MKLYYSRVCCALCGPQQLIPILDFNSDFIFLHLDFFFFFFFSLKTVEVMKILFQKELNSARMILHCMASGQSSLNMSKLLHSHSQCDNFPKHDQKKKRRKNAEMKRTNWTESYWNMENSCSNAQCSSKLKSEYSGNVPQRNKTSNTIITTLQCSNGWISLVYSHIENK